MVLVDAEHPSNSFTTMVENVIGVNQETLITENTVKAETSMIRQEDIGKRAENMAVKILGNMITSLRLLPSFRTVFNELIKYLKDAKYLDANVSKFPHRVASNVCICTCMYLYMYVYLFISFYVYLFV